LGFLDEELNNAYCDQPSIQAGKPNMLTRIHPAGKDGRAVLARAVALA
jgi:hypothetical protein